MTEQGFARLAWVFLYSESGDIPQQTSMQIVTTNYILPYTCFARLALPLYRRLSPQHEVLSVCCIGQANPREHIFENRRKMVRRTIIQTNNKKGTILNTLL